MIFRIPHAQDGVTSGHLNPLGVTWGHLMALVVPFGVALGLLALAWRSLGVTWDGHLGLLEGTCESLWGHFGVTWASSWPQHCITVDVAQKYVKHTTS